MDNMYLVNVYLIFCRIGGLIGPNERAILPRTLKCLRIEILKYVYLLQEDLKVDFLFIDNAVQAHIKVCSTYVGAD